MDKQKLQQDKLILINWITQIQDHALIEKIKTLITTSDNLLRLTKEQQEIQAIEKGKETDFPKDIDTLRDFEL
jgi:hypothetical protein